MEHPLTVWRGQQSPPLTKQALADLVGKRWKAIHRVEAFEVVPSYELARAIERQTLRAVRVDDMISPEVRAAVKAKRDAKRPADEAA